MNMFLQWTDSLRLSAWLSVIYYCPSKWPYY